MNFTCFYSYKGGVGRSLILANLAYVLAWAGRKVLIVDLDLEAPGQHKTDLFYEHTKPQIHLHGILDLLIDFRKHQKKQEKQEIKNPFEWKVEKYIYRSTVFDVKNAARKPLVNRNKNKPTGSIWLMPASGSADEKFQVRLAGWSWENFYSKYNGEAFLQAFKWRLRSEEFDDVLIDSRTGLNEVFYVSTLSLADSIVFVSGLNRQNIEGTALAVQTVKAVHNSQRYGDKRIILAFSPLPRPSISENEIKKRFLRIKDEWPGLKQWDAEIPYVPALALKERILVMESDDPELSEDHYVKGIITLRNSLESPEKAIIAPAQLNEEITNPFPALRVEYWREKEVANFFIDPGGNLMLALKQFMPTLLFGSRGTGKTMLARWFSYDTQKYFLESKGKSAGPDTIDCIALWFRLDIDLLYAFNTDEEELRPFYDTLFGQFLDVIILRKALAALETLGGIKVWGPTERLYKILAREMGQKTDSINYEKLEEILDTHLAEIRAYINNPYKSKKPYIIQANILMKLLVEVLIRYGNFTPEHYFTIFVDEYENFHKYQQKIVNTRLKQVNESDRVTYKLLARNQGVHTYETLAKDQDIEEIHDFRSYNLDEGIKYDIFYNHIRDIVRKHLKGSDFFSMRGFTDPEKLFVSLSPQEEARAICKKRGNKQLISRCREIAISC